ncbi:glycosyltransferase [Nostoc sp. CHAB 5834]|nr:glycosyltransferase [Nostoc sp. CHAB 5834]
MAIAMIANLKINTDVVVTSTVRDSYNTNWPIRDYLAAGFSDSEELDISAIACPLDQSIQVVDLCGARMLICVGGLALPSADLWQFRRIADKKNIPLVLWLHDDPYEFDYAYRAKGLADFVFTNDAATVPFYSNFGIKAHHLPLAACKNIHYRDVLEPELKFIDYFFCGYAYPNRAEFFASSAIYMKSFYGEIFGAGWPSFVERADNRRLSPEMVATKSQKSRFVVNIGREMNIANRRFEVVPSTPGPRTFETALSGAAQAFLCNSLEIADYFDPHSEIVLIDSGRELKEAIERSFEEPDWLASISKRAQQRALSDHTYSNRAKTIIDVTGFRGV